MKTKIIIALLMAMTINQAFSQTARRPRPPAYAHNYHVQSMHPADFDMLLQTLSTQGSDSRRLLIARQAVENNFLNAGQVARLTSLFSFERNRLELAKIAWHTVIDPGNYFAVFNVFSFNSSVRDLQVYMSAYPRSQPFSSTGRPPQYHHQPIRPMHEANFRQARQVVAAQSFEDSKLHSAKQIAMFNNLSSRQVADLMQVFAFEESRLALAVFAYPYVFDPGNYFLTHRAFRFSSSIEALNRSISYMP